MPVSRARRLCPTGVFVQPNFPAYIRKSQQIKEIFDSFSPAVEPLSLDEAFLDVRTAHRIWPNSPTIAEALKDRVLTATGLVLSVGVAPNKFLAKLASRLAKPDGVVVVEHRGVPEFLAPLDVEYLWGVGEQTATVLRRLGLKTIGDVAATPAAYLERVLGAPGANLSALAAGRDERPVVPNLEAKSVGGEETYAQDLTERAQIAGALLKLADRVASRLRSQGISGQTVALKVRLGDFTTFSRSRTLKFEIDSATGIYGVAGELLSRFFTEHPGKSIRLLGISVSNLCRWPASQQLVFPEQAGWGAAELTLDAVRRRFGDDAIGFGALLGVP
jgi:DNA polymerase-4